VNVLAWPVLLSQTHWSTLRQSYFHQLFAQGLRLFWRPGIEGWLRVALQGPLTVRKARTTENFITASQL
jgi:hypothetical protein